MSSNKRFYKDKFREMYQIEKQARDAYQGFYDSVSDEHLRKIFSEMITDEEKHMALCQRLVDMSSS